MKRYELPYFANEHAGIDTPGWTARDYALCSALGVEDNYAAERMVRKAVLASGTGLSVVFDSEMGCFFAYTDSEHEMEVLAGIVADLVASGPHPEATPGTDMAQSIAFLGDRGTW